jgi:catechol 2,3-dioxygenase-like lactoylglutathione lyase family enzyme
MTVLGVSHVAIGVTDMDAALAFYRDVLALEVTADWTQRLSAEQGPELHGGRAIERRLVWLRWSNGLHEAALALDQLLSPEPADKRAELYDLGTHHVALWVSDVDAVIARARAGGHPVLMPHTTGAENYGEPAGLKIHSVFLRDPDGNLVQCDQRA